MDDNNDGGVLFKRIDLDVCMIAVCFSFQSMAEKPLFSCVCLFLLGPRGLTCTTHPATIGSQPSLLTNQEPIRELDHSISTSPYSTVERVLGHPGLHCEILSPTVLPICQPNQSACSNCPSILNILSYRHHLSLSRGIFISTSS